jgi:hypothetical protein
MENYIGKVLDFNQASYNASIQAYQKAMSAIDKAGAAFEALDSTFVFNQEVYKDMLAHKSANIHKQYSAIIDAQIKSLNFTSKAVIDSLRSKIVVDIQGLEDTIEAMASTAGQGSLYDVHFDLSNISIIKGKAVLADETKEKIKNLCETKVRTDDQNELYNYALQLQADYKKFADFIKEKNPKITQAPYPSTFLQNDNGRFTENKGELIINPNVLFGI